MMNLRDPHQFSSNPQSLTTSSSQSVFQAQTQILFQLLEDASQLNQFQKHLEQCADCCKDYRTICNQLEDSKFNQLFRADLSRIKGVLQQESIINALSLRDNIKVSLCFYDVLSQPFLLTDSLIASNLSQKLSLLLRETQKLFVPVYQGGISIGFIWLMISADQTFRSWSTQVIRYLNRKQQVYFDFTNNLRMMCKIWKFIQEQTFLSNQSRLFDSSQIDYDYVKIVFRMLDSRLAEKFFMISLKVLQKIIQSDNINISAMIRIVADQLKIFQELRLSLQSSTLDFLEKEILSKSFPGIVELVDSLAQYLSSAPQQSEQQRLQSSATTSAVQINPLQSLVRQQTLSSFQSSSNLRPQIQQSLVRKPIQKPRSAAFQQLQQVEKQTLVPSIDQRKRNQNSKDDLSKQDASKMPRLTVQEVQRPAQPSESRKIQFLGAPVEKSKSTLILLPGQESLPFIQRSVEKFIQKIISWDIFNLKQSHIRPVNIPDTFSSSNQYVDVFEPLLTIECIAQLQQNFEELAQNSFLPASVQTITAVDDFHEILFERLKAQIGEDLSENDLIVLSPSDVLFKELENCNVIGRVKSVQKTNGLVSTFTAQVNCRKNISLFRKLSVKSQWKFSQLSNLNTTIRELNGLYDVNKLVLLKQILSPHLQRFKSNNVSIEYQQDKISKKFGLNLSQAKAVAASVSMEPGFTLIQGPAGNGKTKTLIAFLGELFYRPGHLLNPLEPKKVLLCAPSNAAVDEMVRRLRNGILISDTHRMRLKIVRLGTMEGIHESVKDVTLDHLIDVGMAESDDSLQSLSSDIKLKIKDLKIQMSDIKAKLNQLYLNLDQVDNMDEKDSIDSEIKQAYQLKLKLVEKLNACYYQKDSGIKALDNLKQKLKRDILNDADVICCTLGSSGHDVFNLLNQGFDYLVVDEACQAIELSTLVPLKYNVRRCILVGDPNQLPPTIISQDAKQYGYDQSLFVRLQKTNPDCVHLLNVQYRMHPEISKFPTRMIYEGKLQDGPDMLSLNTRI